MKLQRELLEREDGARLMQRRIGMLEVACEDLKQSLNEKRSQLQKLEKERSPEKHLEDFKKSMNEKLQNKEKLINEMNSRLKMLEQYLTQRGEEIEAFSEEIQKRESMSKEETRR